MAQSKQAFGGDDDSSNQPQSEPVKKLDLKKYASKPDMNIRDLFWDILASYAAKKPPAKEELKALAHERMALMRIALSVLANPQSAYFGLSRNLTALYSMMLMLDASWEDAFEEFIIKSYEEEQEPAATVLSAIDRLCKITEYKENLKLIFKKMSKDHQKIEALFSYLAKTEENELISALKKEIMIIAKSDIEQNQHYAMIALSKIMDLDVKNTLIGLIGHWDPETRKVAIELLKKEKDPNVIIAAKRQLGVENEPSIKKMLEKMAVG